MTPRGVIRCCNLLVVAIATTTLSIVDVIGAAIVGVARVGVGVGIDVGTDTVIVW